MCVVCRRPVCGEPLFFYWWIRERIGLIDECVYALAVGYGRCTQVAHVACVCVVCDVVCDDMRNAIGYECEACNDARA